MHVGVCVCECDRDARRTGYKWQMKAINSDVRIHPSPQTKHMPVFKMKMNLHGHAANLLENV